MITDSRTDILITIFARIYVRGGGEGGRDKKGVMQRNSVNIDYTACKKT